MPKISPENAEVYGAEANASPITFRERLMKRFAAHEWVRVINIDDERLVWQYLPSHAETFEITTDPTKHVYRDDVEIYALDPGENEVLIGENAYLMIENLYKKVIAKKVIQGNPNQDKHMARSFNWTDGLQQERFIDRIYLGKESPSFAKENKAVRDAQLDLAPQPSLDDTINKDLGIVDEPKQPAKRGPKPGKRLRAA